MEKTYLIDTNIVTEFARAAPNNGVVDFVVAIPRFLVSTILFHELSFGLETAKVEQKARLATFIAAMRERFGHRAVPVDLVIAETAGRLRAFEKGQGRVLTLADGLIAATAMVSDAVLVTRNTKDFVTLGIPLVNPFSALSPQSRSSIRTGTWSDGLSSARRSLSIVTRTSRSAACGESNR